ncbi:MAG: M28 family peptidase [Luteitalea sp.]|nr:M28 family peptidase [Luteitalea sp.]
MMRRLAVRLVVVLLFAAVPLAAAGGRVSFDVADLREWLTYLSSDELQGRRIYTEGQGLAAGYILTRLKEWGVKPGGDAGGYLQTVRVLGVKVNSRSSVTVQVGDERRTFKDGDGVNFPKNAGAKRSLTVNRVEFTGYGLEAPSVEHHDLRGKDLRGAAVVFLGSNGPKSVDAQAYRRLLTGRSRSVLDQMKGIATLGPAPAPRPEQPSAGGRRADAPDFTTAQRFDQEVAPAITAADAFYELLFSRAPVKYEELRRKAENQEPLPSFRLSDVTLTFNVDADYTVVRTQLTSNVVGLVEGTDPDLKATYVAFGAHYDHVGYAQSELTGEGRPSPPGKVTPGKEADRIWNGADDDGSGTVALMAIARAFATGPRPRRSLLFVWHAGEESGLLGSRYFADHPAVPLDRIAAQLNIDMIGRNRGDLATEANTVYLVGSDRISSELHQLSGDANRALPRPLTLDYEMNDPGDLEQVYYRSDHFSYAAKGIPVIFFTTGLHADYHANTDEVSKIEFPKLARVAGLVYETGVRLANLDHMPARDNKGPRAGKGAK